MKRFFNFQSPFLLVVFFFVLLMACNQKKEKTTAVIPESQSPADTSSRMPPSMQNATPETRPSVETPKEPEHVAPSSTVPMKPKVCETNFTLIASPKKNQKIFYVSGFNPGEFKCWNEIEDYSVQICSGSPCVLYFLDKPDPKVTAAAPNYLDAATLLKNGIGRYENSGKVWEMKGSSIWGRKDKGYGYYNAEGGGG